MTIEGKKVVDLLPITTLNSGAIFYVHNQGTDKKITLADLIGVIYQARSSFNQVLPIKNITSNYSVLKTDYTINCTANSFTVTLPTAVGITGMIFNIKNSGTGVITIATTSSQTIDGGLTAILSIQYTNLTLQSTGQNWIIL